MDDFYVTSQDLAVIETTNVYFNDDLFEKITTDGLLCWQGAMIANRISSTGREWTENFSKFNAGTYNNMFMILDMKKVDLDKNKIQNEALYIIEQIPGTFQIGDVSDVLIQDGYWASYNIPYFENIYELSGYPARYEQYGDKYSYYNCSRANIFRRDQSSVLDVDDMKRIMRYNDFQHDPDSAGNPTDSISSRYDLKANVSYRDAFGGIDSKLTSSSLVPELSGYAQSGPTHDQQTVFTWSNWTKSVSDQPLHVGHPDAFNFDYQFFTPSIFSPSVDPTPAPSPQPSPFPINGKPIFNPVIDVPRSSRLAKRM